MKGTEKQIAWATEILENVKTAFEAIRNLPANEISELIINACNREDLYAGDIIELFNRIDWSDPMAAAATCVSRMRVSPDLRAKFIGK